MGRMGSLGTETAADYAQAHGRAHERRASGRLAPPSRSAKPLPPRPPHEQSHEQSRRAGCLGYRAGSRSQRPVRDGVSA